MGPAGRSHWGRLAWEPAAEAAGGPDPDALPREEQLEAAREAALRLLTAKARSRAELSERLLRRGYAPDVVEEVLDRLQRVELVDDRAVAGRHAEQGVARGLAAAAIGYELRRRGIGEEVTAQAIAGATGGADEVARCREVAAARQRRLRGLPPEVRQRRLAGYLARRGYSPDVVAEALEGLTPLADDAS